MKKLLIIISFGFFSCGQQSKKIPAASTETYPPETKTTAATQPEMNSTDGDPAFVIAKDTVSTHGPRSITRSVLQDKNGTIWFATWEGIVRFDGKIFTNITLKEGLKHWTVFSILEDKTGNLWFGTVGGGVYRYNPASGAFTLFTTTDGLAGNSVMCMLEDKAGNIWFGTTNGVSLYGDNTFTNFTKQDGLSDNFISSIAEDRTGKFWFATNGGVNCYVPSASILPGKKSFTNFTINKDLSFHNVRTLLEDKTGNIWISSAEGFWRYDHVSGVLTHVSKNSPSYIFEDETGNLWLNAGGSGSTTMILYSYDGKSVKEIVVSNTPQAPFFNQIFGITKDRDGNIWFGTATGACRYDGKSFNRFTENISNQ